MKVLPDGRKITQCSQCNYVSPLEGYEMCDANFHCDMYDLLIDIGDGTIHPDCPLPDAEVKYEGHFVNVKYIDHPITMDELREIHDAEVGE